MGAVNSADNAEDAQSTHAADVQATVDDTEAAAERVHTRPVPYNAEDASEVRKDFMQVPSLWPDVVQTLGDVTEFSNDEDGQVA